MKLHVFIEFDRISRSYRQTRNIIGINRNRTQNCISAFHIPPSPVRINNATGQCKFYFYIIKINRPVDDAVINWGIACVIPEAKIRIVYFTGKIGWVTSSVSVINPGSVVTDHIDQNKRRTRTNKIQTITAIILQCGFFYGNIRSV